MAQLTEVVSRLTKAQVSAIITSVQAVEDQLSTLDSVDAQLAIIQVKMDALSSRFPELVDMTTATNMREIEAKYSTQLSSSFSTAISRIETLLPLASNVYSVVVAIKEKLAIVDTIKTTYETIPTSPSTTEEALSSKTAIEYYATLLRRKKVLLAVKEGLIPGVKAALEVFIRELKSAEAEK